MPATLESEKYVTLKNILLATDFSPVSECALGYAAAISQLNEAQLVALHAVPPEPRLPVPLGPCPTSFDPALAEAKINLGQFTSTETLRHARPKEIAMRGSVWNVVSDTIQQKQIDFLVVGTHARTGLKRIVLGSVAEELFRRASCPVLTVGPSAVAGRPIRKVLFATDFGPSSVEALPYAIDFANQSGGELILLHLVPPLPAEYVGPFWYPGINAGETEKASKRNLVEQMRNLLPSESSLMCKVDCQVEFQFPPEGIIHIAIEHHVDMIVMGVRKSGLNPPRLAAHMPWASAYKVVCHAGCPVLTVRG